MLQITIMDKSELIEIISKYKKGIATAEEEVIVQKYFDFLSNKAVMTVTVPEDMQESKARIWNAINTQKAHKTRKQKLNWMAIAASALLIVCSTLIVLTYSKEEIK